MSAPAQDDSASDAFKLALFQALAEAEPGYVSCIDRQRRVLYLNRTLSRDMTEILGKPMDAFVAVSHRQATIDCVERAFSTGERGELEYAVELGDGTRRYISTRVIPFTGPKGEALALMLTEDTTESRELQEKLDHSLEFRRRIVENLPDFVIMIDRERHMVWFNRVASGLSEKEVLGKRVDDYITGGSMPAAKAAIDAAFDLGMLGQYETEGYGDGSHNAWYLVRVAPVVLDGKVEHVLLITSDITERKRAERALREREEQLQRAQRLESLGQMAGGIAHDFNNLLQIIGGNLAFAQQSLARGESAREELDQALRATERAAELTSHLLAIGRRKRIDSKRVELGKLVAHSVRMLRRAIPANIALTCDVPPEPYFVELDAPQFDQVLINLCVNARDAMPQGGALTVRVEGDGAANVIVSVADTGSGIAPKDLSRVFEPFFTTKRGGSGLGLAVAAGIVAAHGGTITAKSDGRAGTTIQVRLPRVVPLQPSRSASSPKLDQSGAGTILVAEDEDMVRAQVVRILERSGYTVLQAANGALAVELFRERGHEVDLVLLDVIMPELDGWQACLQIEEMQPAIKVLFTTGYAANVLPEDFRARGARLLSKPYLPQQLLQEIRELLSQTSRRTSVRDDRA